MTSRDAYLRRTYGISEAEYDAIVAQQGGVCFVCRKPPKPGTNLHVDHDHKTGLLRGALCHHCNFRVIGRQRNPDIFFRAYMYLNSPPAVTAIGEKYVPKKPRRRRRAT